MAPESLPEANDWLFSLINSPPDWVYVEPSEPERGDEPDQ